MEAMVLEMSCDRPRGVAKLLERQCAGTRRVLLVKYAQRPYQRRHVRRTPPFVVDDEDEDVVSLVVPASWNSESARIPR
jgi:hypothetical protein